MYDKNIKTQYQPDELMVTGAIYDHELRKRSFEMTSKILSNYTNSQSWNKTLRKFTLLIDIFEREEYPFIMTKPIKVIYLNSSTPPHIITLVSLAGMSALSMNIFLPSLPGMTAYFDTSYAIMNLSISMYLAVTAVLQLFIGPISDRVGRRPVVLISFSIFFNITLCKALL